MPALLSWRLVWRDAGPESAAAARPGERPAQLVSLAPRLRPPGLPLEVAQLLPNQDGCRALLAALRECQPPAASAAGLFLADPFLQVERAAGALRAAGIVVVANLPSVGQHEADFYQQLADVGLDGARELAALAAFRAQGFASAAVVCDAEAARAAARNDPDLILALPKIAGFAAGFPSLRQRGVLAQAVRATLSEEGWSGPLLLLADRTEATHQRLWPDCVDGVICRPEPVQADP
jgi:predicted TIM-barrel enzyme